MNSLKLFNIFYIFQKNLSNSLSGIFAFFYVKVYSVFLVLINILIWIFAQHIMATGTEQIALHYTVDFGIDFYGDARQIFIIPILGLIIILFNFIIVIILSQNKDFVLLSHILLIAALLSNIVLLAAISSVYLINFR
ncbi:hypothetical protein KAJ61_02385 [Candidatus Parcubacteria bacterium]|nr:hypothetical protein [Candidatus Parcubacteria bacterium]